MAIARRGRFKTYAQLRPIAIFLCGAIGRIRKSDFETGSSVLRKQLATAVDARPSPKLGRRLFRATWCDLLARGAEIEITVPGMPSGIARGCQHPSKRRVFRSIQMANQSETSYPPTGSWSGDWVYLKSCKYDLLIELTPHFGKTENTRCHRSRSPADRGRGLLHDGSRPGPARTLGGSWRFGVRCAPS